MAKTLVGRIHREVRMPIKIPPRDVTKSTSGTILGVGVNSV